MLGLDVRARPAFDDPIGRGLTVKTARITRRGLTVMLAAAATAFLTSCAPTGAPTNGPASSASPASTAPPGAVASSHFDDPCADGRPIDGPTPADGDLVIGALSYAGGTTYAQLSPEVAPSPSDDATFYKMGAQLPAHTSATVRIISPDASTATIVSEKAPEAGTRSVTYTNCRDSAQWWVAGFLLWGEPTGCVVLEATSSAGPTPQRATLSLNAGSCP
jgi:hypothetical protein